MLTNIPDCFDADHLWDRCVSYRRLVPSPFRSPGLVENRTYRPADMGQLSSDTQISRTRRSVLQTLRPC